MADEVIAGRHPTPDGVNRERTSVFVANHAAERTALLKVRATGGQLTVEVRDDGVGGAEISPHDTGLVGLHDRIGAVEGTLTTTSPRGGPGTTLTARIPSQL